MAAPIFETRVVEDKKWHIISHKIEYHTYIIFMNAIHEHKITKMSQNAFNSSN